MDTYLIMASTQAEYQKADDDPAYAPSDFEVYRFEAEHHQAALKKFRRVCAVAQWYRPQLLEV